MPQSSRQAFAHLPSALHDRLNTRVGTIVFTACLITFSAGIAADEADQPQADAVSRALTAILEEQAAAWNRGDIEAFMQHYWKSDQLTFSAAGRTRRGWQETRDGYHQRYPDRQAMGQLTFTNLEITPLCKDAALMLGRWHLKRSIGDLEGNFSLVFRHLDGRWVIIHDHSSQLTDE